jgi:hypothetical protein
MSSGKNIVELWYNKEDIIRQNKSKGFIYMYAQFQKVIKNAGFRGWRLDEDEGRLYLSKFEEMFNDNEIRIFVEVTPTKINIVGGTKIKNYSKIGRLDLEKNPYVKEAKHICEAYRAEVTNARRAL